MIGRRVGSARVKESDRHFGGPPTGPGAVSESPAHPLVAQLADATDSRSVPETGAGSSPAGGTVQSSEHLHRPDGAVLAEEFRLGRRWVLMACECGHELPWRQG